MKGKFVNALLMTILVILVAGGAFAQTPANTILYQGKLTDDTGAPITTATSVQFTIYTALVGGSNLFSTTVPTLTPDENGLFTVELGPLTTTVLNGDKRYLGIKVGSDAEMTPRQLLTSAPAAHSSFAGPGVAYKNHLPANTFIDLSATAVSYDSITVNAPGPGYIHVFGNVVLRINHTTGTTSDFQFQVLPTPNTIDFSMFGFADEYISASGPTAMYFATASVQRIYTIFAAGDYTYYANMRVNGGYETGDDYLNLEITAIYYPKNYGDVGIPDKSGNNSTIIGTNNQ